MHAPNPAVPTVVPVDRVLGATLVVAVALLVLLFANARTLSPADGPAKVALAGGALVGLLLPLVFLHPFRVTGLCPPAVLLAGVAVLAAWLADGSSPWLTLLLGFATGVGVGARMRYWLAGPRRRLWLPDVAAVTGVCGFALWHIFFADTSAAAVQISVLVFAVLLIAFAWVRLFRPLFELCVEVLVWRNYRISGHGPGIATFPAKGPVLVIANHACWWDPLFLAKVLPRPITPMMTSAFYDKWFLKPLMVYVFQTIRVADLHIRREAPEIQQAIQALDQGKCVVIFPEGFLRRKEEVPLRRFGRGVWEILKARPQTPVVAGWIEGGWGSYASYWNGPPTKNKPREGRRAITIGLAEPHAVDPAVLQYHLQTRLALMNAVSRAREHLGLPVLPPFEWKGGEDAYQPIQPSEPV